MTKQVFAVTGAVALIGLAGGFAMLTSAASPWGAAPVTAASDRAEPTSGPSQTATPTAPTPTGSPDNGPEPTAIDNPGAPPASGPASRGPDRPAAPTPSRVIRPGSTAAPKASIAANGLADLPGKVSFADGLVVASGKSRSAVQIGLGPGAMPGDPYVLLPVTVTNGSKDEVMLNRVVAHLRYGDPALGAAPVYTEQTQDLSGRLAPGDTVQATYAFALPTDKRRNVTLSFDIDNTHALALFHGDVS